MQHLPLMQRLVPEAAEMLTEPSTWSTCKNAGTKLGLPHVLVETCTSKVGMLRLRRGPSHWRVPPLMTLRRRGNMCHVCLYSLCLCWRVLHASHCAPTRVIQPAKFAGIFVLHVLLPKVRVPRRIAGPRVRVRLRRMRSGRRRRCWERRHRPTGPGGRGLVLLMHVTLVPTVRIACRPRVHS